MQKKYIVSLLLVSAIFVGSFSFFTPKVVAAQNNLWDVATMQLGDSASSTRVTARAKDLARRFKITVPEWGILGTRDHRKLSRDFLRSILASITGPSLFAQVAPAPTTFPISFTCDLSGRTLTVRDMNNAYQQVASIPCDRATTSVNLPAGSYDFPGFGPFYTSFDISATDGAITETSDTSNIFSATGLNVTISGVNVQFDSNLDTHFETRLNSPDTVVNQILPVGVTTLNLIPDMGASNPYTLSYANILLASTQFLNNFNLTTANGVQDLVYLPSSTPAHIFVADLNGDAKNDLSINGVPFSIQSSVGYTLFNEQNSRPLSDSIAAGTTTSFTGMLPIIYSFRSQDTNAIPNFNFTITDSNGTIDPVGLPTGVSASGNTLTIGTPAQPSCPPNSLCGQWNFDDNTANDTSGLNNHGTLQNGAFIVSGALSLDGVNDYVEIADNPAMEISPELTISAKIKPPVIDAGYHQIASRFASGNLAYELGLIPNGGVSLYYSGNGVDYSFIWSAEGLIQANVWSDVTATFNRGVVKLYVNGVEVASKTDTVIVTLNNTGTSPLNIGRDPRGLEYFNGVIDEVRIYNYVVTPIPPAPTGCPDRSLCGQWNFDDNTANDISGLNNNGTLQNGATVITDPTRGQVLSLDGANDYVSVPHSDSLNVAGPITLMAWFKTNNSPDYSGIINKFDNLTGYQTGMHLDGGTRADFGKNGEAYLTAGMNSQNTEDGLWHHLAATYDGTEARLYIDGVRDPVGTRGGDGFNTPNNHELNIGNDFRYFPDRLFSGLIDDTRVYNYAWTSCEIADLVGAPQPAECAPTPTVTVTAVDESYRPVSPAQVVFGRIGAAGEGGWVNSPYSSEFLEGANYWIGGYYPAEGTYFALDTQGNGNDQIVGFKKDTTYYFDSVTEQITEVSTPGTNQIYVVFHPFQLTGAVVKVDGDFATGVSTEIPNSQVSISPAGFLSSPQTRTTSTGALQAYAGYYPGDAEIPRIDTGGTLGFTYLTNIQPGKIYRIDGRGRDASGNVIMSVLDNTDPNSSRLEIVMYAKPACGIACQIEEALDQNGNDVVVTIPDESKWQIVSVVAGSNYAEVRGNQGAQMTINSGVYGRSEIKNSYVQPIVAKMERLVQNNEISQSAIRTVIYPKLSDLNQFLTSFSLQAGMNKIFEAKADPETNEPSMFITNGGIDPVPTWMNCFQNNNPAAGFPCNSATCNHYLETGKGCTRPRAPVLTENPEVDNFLDMDPAAIAKWMPKTSNGIQTFESVSGNFRTSSLMNNIEILQTEFANLAKVKFIQEGPAYRSVMSALTGGIAIRDLTVPAISNYVSLGQGEKIGLAAQRIGNIVSVEKRSSSKERPAIAGRAGFDAGYSNFASSLISGIQNIYEFSVGAFGAPETITPIELSFRPISDFAALKQDLVSNLQINASRSSLVEAIAAPKLTATNGQALASGKTARVQYRFKVTDDTIDSRNFVYGISASPLSVLVVEESKVASAQRSLDALSISSVSVAGFKAEKDSVTKEITHVFDSPKLGTITMFKADMSDGDNDGVPALFDDCSAQAGAIAGGCPFGVKPELSINSVDMRLSNKVEKVLPNGTLVKVYDFAPAVATDLYKQMASLYEGNTEVGSCVTTNGTCYAGVPTQKQYSVISKSVVNGYTVYTAAPVAGENFGSDMIAKKVLNATLTIDKNGTPKSSAANQVVTFTGSLLNLYEPALIEIADTTEYVSFVYETPDTAWEITSKFVPPQGCNVDATEKFASVSQEVEAIVFTLSCDTSAIGQSISSLSAQALDALTAKKKGIAQSEMLINDCVARNAGKAKTCKTNTHKREIGAVKKAKVEKVEKVLGPVVIPQMLTKTLKLGMADPEVKLLQMKLNAKGFLVASTGPGSRGNEVESFGSLTVAAVKRFQAANRLSADGIVGSRTRALLNQ